MAKNYTVDIEKQEIIFTDKVTSEENLEIAKLQAVGYKAIKQASTKGKDKKWYLSKLPNDEARDHFNELCSSAKGLVGYRKAVAWAKDTFPEIYPSKSKSKK